MISIVTLFEQNVDASASKKVEQALGVKLPKDYANFLNKFGSFEGDGIELLGTWKGDKYRSHPSVVFGTISERKYDLNDEYVVIHVSDEFNDVINTIDGKVYQIPTGSNVKPKQLAKSFKDYLIKIFAPSVPNLTDKKRILDIARKI